MNVDLSSVIQAVLGLCAVAISIFGGIALNALAARFKMQISASQTAAYDSALTKALTFGATAVDGTIRAKGWDHVDTKSAVVGSALTYLVAQFPDALKGVGLTTNADDPANAAKIKSALQRALPAAMLAAAASPSTPPASPVAPVVAAASPLFPRV